MTGLLPYRVGALRVVLLVALLQLVCRAAVNSIASRPHEELCLIVAPCHQQSMLDYCFENLGAPTWRNYSIYRIFIKIDSGRGNRVLSPLPEDLCKMLVSGEDSAPNPKSHFL